MADDKPGLHIDTDWKKQAQEEKRRQQEKERQNAAVSGDTAPAADAPVGRRGAPGARQLPPASFGSLVQTLMTQSLYYLGDLAVRGQQGAVDLDMAKHQVDSLAVLEEKTRNNLSEDEKRLLDTALYEVRMRYVSVASQFLGP